MGRGMTGRRLSDGSGAGACGLNAWEVGPSTGGTPQKAEAAARIGLAPRDDAAGAAGGVLSRRRGPVARDAERAAPAEAGAAARTTRGGAAAAASGAMGRGGARGGHSDGPARGTRSQTAAPAADATAFLGRAGWGGASRAALAGDASGRRYERLTEGARTAVLMIAAPDAAPSLRAFLDVAGRLAGLGLSAPAVLAAEPEAGLMLLEDLGDALLAREAAAHPEGEPALYAAAAGVLVALRAAGPPLGLPLYDAAAMAEATALAAPWYARAEEAPWVGPLREALARHAGPADTLILRDYHAENLIWLPERRGAARLGLLDFQDAMRGPAAYDLASLTRDARREVSPAAVAAATARFADGTDADPGRLDAALAVLGAQRALRILGVFARLARQGGKPRYLPLLPRVWGQLTADLDHPACAGLRGPVLGALPPPAVASARIVSAAGAPAPEIAPAGPR